MKKLLTLLILPLLITSAAKAQDLDYEPAPMINYDGLRFGVFFAPNISWMRPTANKSDNREYFVENNGSRTGYSWGLMVDYFFAENYGISSGFHLNTTGGKILATYNPTAIPPGTANIVNSADFHYRLQYLELPFNLKFRTDDLGGGLRAFGNIGPSLAINVSKKVTYDVTYTQQLANGPHQQHTSGENEKLTGSFAIAPAMLQLNVGAGLEYPLTAKTSIYAGLFFNNGFAPDVTNPKEYEMDYAGSFTDGTVRVNNFSLRIGLFF